MIQEAEPDPDSGLLEAIAEMAGVGPWAGLAGDHCENEPGRAARLGVDGDH